LSEHAELSAKRERLIERFTVMQSDLGGVLYEMVVRDSLDLDVLKRKVAELQKVDAELGHVEHALKAEDSGVAGECPQCDAPYTRGATFCWRCGHALATIEVVEPGK
jgi:hypothetical protein